MKPLVLFVDDCLNARDAFERTFRKEAYEIISVSGGIEALEILQTIAIRVLVTDQKMPGLSGTELLTIARQEFPDTVRIILTGERDFEIAVDAINNGNIYRFFTKPYNEVDLGIAIRQAMSQGKTALTNKPLMISTKQPASCMESLESLYPGISEMKKNEQGMILLNSCDQSLASIVEEMEKVNE